MLAEGRSDADILKRLLNNAVRSVTNIPKILLGSVVTLGDRVSDGEVVEAVTIPWCHLARELKQDPSLLFKFDPRKLEELIAAAYYEEGFEVILTPRSGDGGKDVIATKPGRFSIRVLDQVKRYKPGHLVTAEEVRAMLGVLARDPKASKAYVTTTADFAPGVRNAFADTIPTRLDLRNGEMIQEWVQELAHRKG